MRRRLELVTCELAVEEGCAQTEEPVASRRELERPRDSYADLFDFAPVGYATLDAMGCIQDINLTGAALFGLERSRVIDSSLSSYVVPEHRRRLVEHLRASRCSTQTVTTELALLSGSGPIPVQLWSKRVSDQDGAPAIRTVLLDLSEKRRAEAELKEINQKLEARTRMLEQQTSVLRRLRRQLVEAQDAERRRIATLLHDDVQQALFAIRLKVSLLPGGGEARELEAIVDRTIATCRELSAELSPPILHGLGLTASLHWLSDQMRANHGLEVTIQAPDQLELSHPARLALYNAVRELLFNVVKHADTRQARVEVVYGDDLIVEVRDDGRGFTMGGGQGGTHMGLANIAENLDALGGSLTIASSPGGGTLARLVLPEAALLPPALEPRSSRPPARAEPARGAGEPARLRQATGKNRT